MGNVLHFPLVAIGAFYDQDWKIPRKSWILNCIFYSVWILILLVLFWNIAINFDKISKTYIFALKEWCSFLLDGVSGFSSVFLKGNTFYFTRSKLLYCKHLPMLYVQEFTQYKYCTLKVQFILYISLHNSYSLYRTRRGWKDKVKLPLMFMHSKKMNWPLA